jgi:FdhE protein
LAQEESKNNADVGLMTIAPDRLSDAQRPLIHASDFPIDYPGADRLLARLSDIAQELAPGLARSAVTLKNAVRDNLLARKKLFSAITHDNDGMIHDMGKSLGIPAQDLAFFAYGAIVPSILACVSQLKSYLADRSPWAKGSCPVCGNHPDMAFFDTDGAGHLVCCFCMHAWAFQRLLCAFCGNRDPAALHYFAHDDEEEYRVDLCDHCRKYLKVVDLRALPREFYPRLEQVSTLHLDRKAKEMGYDKGTSQIA